MIEVMLGAAAAALIAKALDRAEDEAVDQGEGALRRLVQLVRGRFSAAEDTAGSEALEKVEEVPDSKSRIEALERALEAQAAGDPGFRRELGALVQEVEDGGVDLKSAVQTAYGAQSPQFQGIYGSEININYGAQGLSERPRRISD
jgi:hypothetical protein